MSASLSGFAAPAALFVAARLVNMVVGLAMIPLLVHSLGGRGFATWAILLSCSAVFNELQLGMHTAFVREVAVGGRSDTAAVSRMWSTAAGFLVGIHLAALPIVALCARPLGEWLRLPNVGDWHPGSAILLVFVSVAVRAVLMTGTFALFASAHFRQAAALSLGQALVSNASATLVAWLSRDLASALVTFWTAQLTVVGVGFAMASGKGWRPGPRQFDPALMGRLIAYGVRVQLSEWAQIINFQFDKFVVVRVLGLWPAALYEVANRSVLALRSIPASGLHTFLPVAAGGGAGADAPRRMALISLYGILFFFAVPLVIAPVFLYAWVGEMGYVSRHVFACLAVGAAANLLALPLATLAQAAGRPEVQARAAAASILLNVPLSLSLVHVWGLEGAALGTAMAMLLGTAVLLREARAALGTAAVATVSGTVVRHWPLGLVCLACAVAVHSGFKPILYGMTIGVRYGLGPRALAAIAAMALYGACIVLVLVVKWRLIGFASDEREFLERLAAAGRLLEGSLAGTWARWTRPVDRSSEARASTAALRDRATRGR